MADSVSQVTVNNINMWKENWQHWEALSWMAYQ